MKSVYPVIHILKIIEKRWHVNTLSIYHFQGDGFDILTTNWLVHTYDIYGGITFKYVIGIKRRPTWRVPANPRVRDHKQTGGVVTTTGDGDWTPKPGNFHPDNNN